MGQMSCLTKVEQFGFSIFSAMVCSISSICDGQLTESEYTFQFGSETVLFRSSRLGCLRGEPGGLLAGLARSVRRSTKLPLNEAIESKMIPGTLSPRPNTNFFSRPNLSLPNLPLPNHRRLLGNGQEGAHTGQARESLRTYQKLPRRAP